MHEYNPKSFVIFFVSLVDRNNNILHYKKPASFVQTGVVDVAIDVAVARCPWGVELRTARL
jgi:hypothetical protein